jgi:hypothetical protein
VSTWLPIIVGIAIIAGAVLIARLAPDSTWGQELRRSYGVRPTGVRGHRTRRDHLRSAALSLVLAAVLLGTSFGVAILGEDAVLGSSTNTIAETYSFVSFLLAAMATLATVRSLWKAAMWSVELPDTPAHRRALADAIDHLLDGKISPEERAEFLDVRYVQPQLEQIRKATVRLVAQHRTGVPDHYREQIKEWTAGIRASTEPRA